MGTVVIGAKKNGGLAAFLVKKFELNPPLPIYLEGSFKPLCLF